MTTADFYARVGAAIRARRAELKLTQATLATDTGLSRSSVTNIESGGQAILLHQLIDIARVLGTDAAELISAGLAEPKDAAQETRDADAVRATDLLACLSPVIGDER